MKNTYLFKILLSAILMMSLGGCLNEFNEIVPELEGVPAGGITSVRVLNVENNMVELELTSFAVDHFGTFISGLNTQNFSVLNENPNHIYRINSIEEEKDVFVGPYSAAMLFDQSGSINDTDPNNDRILSGTSFVDLLRSGDEAAVAAFSGGGNYQDPYELLVEMGTDRGALNRAIESLAGKAGGGTPLYQAIYNLMPYVGQNGGNDNKAIIAFTDGQDNRGGVSINDIVERACATGVKIYTVGLSNSVDESVLAEIAVRTDGAVMLAEDAIQLVSLYRSLGELLQGSAKLYKMNVSVENTAGTWRSGNRLRGTINLNLSEKYPVRLPFNIGLTSKNAGPIDQREPECACSGKIPDDLVTKWQEKAEEYLSLIANPSPANENITCAYANMYKKNPAKYKWAGLATIVSGQVGNAPDEFILPESFDLAGFLDNLDKGNKAIFSDIFWQHLAFDDGGITEIEKIYCAGKLSGQNYLSLDLYRAWLKINSRDENLIFQGNRDILYHEQKNIVQSKIYDPHPYIWEFIETTTSYIVSPVPGHGEEFPFDNIDDFDDRWEWLEESVLPEWKKFESNSANANTLRIEHGKYCSTCCN